MMVLPHASRRRRQRAVDKPHQAMQDAGAGFFGVCNEARPPASPASAAKHAVQHETKTAAASAEAPAEDKGMSPPHGSENSPLQEICNQSSSVNVFRTPRTQHAGAHRTCCTALSRAPAPGTRCAPGAAGSCGVLPEGHAAPWRCAHRGQRRQCATHATPVMLQMVAAAGRAAHHRHLPAQRRSWRRAAPHTTLGMQACS